MALCPVPRRLGVRHSARRLGCGSLTPDMLGIPRVFLPFWLCGLVLAGCSITGSAKPPPAVEAPTRQDRKSTRLNSSHTVISYAVFCLKKKKKKKKQTYKSK